MPKPGKLLAASALGAVAVAVAALVLSSSGGASAGAANPSASSGSATVDRRTLIATDTESGTLSYANSHTVFNRVSGTITWLPAVGEVIYPGRTLYEIDGAPVILFDGTTPAFRTLSPAVSAGADVLELNRDLVAMGFDSARQIAINDTWQAATTTAVERWQASLGDTQTGTITLGQIVFLPGPQRVTTIDGVLGSTGAGGGSNGAGSSGAGSGSGASATGASTSVIPRTQFVSLASTAPSAASGQAGAPRRSGTGSGSGTGTGAGKGTPGTPNAAKPPGKPKRRAASTAALLSSMRALLRAETAQLRAAGSGSSKPGSSKSGSTAAGRGAGGSGSGSGWGSGSSKPGSTAGSGAGTATAILQTSSTRIIVTVNLDASKQAEAVVGAPVTVQLPTGNTVGGRISAVSPVAVTSGSGSGGSGSGSGGGGSSTPTIPVTITVSGRLPSTGLDQASVSVNFQQQIARDVLSVPVTALLATQGGGYAVQGAAPPHRLIPVSTGLFAAGYVEISGPGIYPGLGVTDSQG